MPKFHLIGMAPQYEISDWYGGSYTASSANDREGAWYIYNVGGVSDVCMSVI